MFGPEALAAAFRKLSEPIDVPVAIHLDHCTDVSLCCRCVDAGYTSVMIDASKKPFEENVTMTRAVVDYAHARGVSVEGELGTITGVEDQVRVTENEAALCDPEKALEFVDRTGVDAFAPAIGTAHGIYTIRDPKLHFDLLETINTLVNSPTIRAPIVIHGGTGLPEQSVRRLVSLGGAKLNVSTELKHVLVDEVFAYVTSHRNEYDPGKIDAVVREKTVAVIGAWMDLLGCSGKAS